MVRSIQLKWRRLMILCALLLCAMLCLAGAAHSQDCGTPIGGTFDEFSRGNQSKTFYHRGFWWMIAPSDVDRTWYLWKYTNQGWVQGIQISDKPKDSPDVWRESVGNRLYVLLPGSSITRLLRLTFSAGSWSIDAGYPTEVNTVQLDEMNLVRAKNGHLWVFWIADSTLRTQRSGDEGATWTAIIDVKTGLNEKQGLTDAVPVRIGGVNTIGVGYAEDSGAPNSSFGFLYHKDSDGDEVWTDQTSLLPVINGTTADDHIAMATHNNQVFMIIKTKGGGSNVIKNGLYHRRANGAWALHPIIKGKGWTRPVITVDITNRTLHVLGTREGPSRNVEMKHVSLGGYAGLLAAPIDTVICDTTDSFFDVSMPPHNVNGTMNLMVVANNESEHNLWSRLLSLGAAPKIVAEGEAEEAEEEVHLAGMMDNFKLAAEVYPNPFNPSTTIRFSLQETTPVRLQIFNISGQLVRTLMEGELQAGEHLRRWDGRNQGGEAVASGTYIYRLQAGPRLVTGQMQLLK